jgi:peptide/nickel transport system substrate-binding protein
MQIIATTISITYTTTSIATATLTVTTPTTVYEKVVNWTTTIPLAIILLVIGIAIGYLIKRK